MEDHIFHAGPAPAGYHQDFEEAIFNSPQHRLLQAAEGWQSFYVLNPKKKRINAAIHFHIRNSIARSPLRNPFGSFEFSESLRPIVLFLFIEYVESELKARGVNRIVIKASPAAYHSGSAVLHTFLLNNNFQVTAAELATSIPVHKNKFADILHRSQRRRLDKARSAKLVFRTIDVGKIQDVYTFIEQCRNEKDYTLSLPLPELMKAIQACKNSYLLFGVFLKQRLVAASISVRVTHSVLYNFYHDHDAGFDRLSPVVLLVEGIYKYCRKHSISLLDLGTSTVDNIPNFGLLNFKTKLGALPNSKLTFEKTIS